MSEDNCIKFPQTIGNITFYTKEELIEWVVNVQKSIYNQITQEWEV